VDSGEPRMPDVPATLYFAGSDGILNNSDDQVKVGALNINGTFSFPNLSAGRYLVGFAAPYSYKFSPPGTDNDVIANGLTDTILLNSTAELRTGIGSGLEPDNTVFQMNFGHLPAAYTGLNIRIEGGAWSLTGPTYLGHSITTAPEGINTVTYTVKKSDDGITWMNDWSSNTGYATISTVCPESGGKRDLYAWFDWNHDDDFEDADETENWVVDCGPDGMSSNIFFTFPGSISTDGRLNNGTYYTRFRIYDEEPADPKPSGVALSASRAYMVGEIEDPFITIGGSQSTENESKNMPGSLPSTGFAYGKTTLLPIQPAKKLYSNTDLVLDIPSLGITATIVGVPQTEEGWDVSWLGKNAGYLYGSAYPTWAGNTVLTGHVWNADNTPGVFVNIKNLKYGDHFFIRYPGQVYTYEVQENKLVYNDSVTPVFKSEIYDWVTLLTCENFNAINDGYQNRRIVRAVLVKVE
jgi:LPXTG-site transpeptidase (sortase) family protein